MSGSFDEQPVNVGSLADTNLDELIDRARRSDDWRGQLDRVIEEAAQLVIADPAAASRPITTYKMTITVKPIVLEGSATTSVLWSS